MAIFKIIGGKAVRYDSGGTDNVDDLTVDFSPAESRENISPADSMKIIFGKIMKWFSDLSGGAASTLLGKNLTDGKVLISDADGKVSASETDASEITYFYGSSDEINSALKSGELDVGTNICCEDDTEFEPSYNITEDRAVITNAEGEFAPSDVTAEELEYLSGVTGNVQEQIDLLNESTVDQYETFPISEYMSVRSGSPINVVKSGRICVVSGEVLANQTWVGSGRNTGLKLPLPVKKIFATGSMYNNEGKTTKILLQEDGELIFQNGLSGSLYGFSITYIVKN